MIFISRPFEISRDGTRHLIAVRSLFYFNALRGIPPAIFRGRAPYKSA
ncbi:hypothetical protein IMCC12053_644 [Celeribacter marinus]|uniref:Uncharacterized protein n=1 Tax=Celeribacter marinus TaxID=1397108 RepID=A0A0N9ZX05_9RHOB|nr:hypothetical protein IMCC12053_644 [Celeribacter marinus]